MKKYSIVDIETTGGGRSGNKIIEIAIINLDGNSIVDKYTTLINPEHRIPVNITYLTGITNEMVSNAPKFYEIAKKIVELTEGRVFVAHNVFFDYNFIKNEFLELGFSFRREKLCTVRLARKYLPGHASYSLGKICEDLGIHIEDRHRALGDATATTELFLKTLSYIHDNDFIISELKKINLPPQINRQTYENLPHQTGVYYFYDKDGNLLYIGKSKDIKKRIAQHFRTNIKRKKDILLKNSIAQIDYKIMRHELLALLFECHEIKQKRPIYNVSFKSRKFTYGVKLSTNNKGALFPKLFSSIEPEQFIFLYKNKKAAQNKIDQTYKVIFGDFSLYNSIDAKINKLIEVIGLKKYNEHIDKVFHFNVPRLNDFIINFDSKSQLVVKDKKPSQIQFLEKNDILETIDLIDDPQMTNIFWSSLVKYKYPINKL